MWPSRIAVGCIAKLNTYLRAWLNFFGTSSAVLLAARHPADKRWRNVLRTRITIDVRGDVRGD